MADKELREIFSTNLKYWLDQRNRTQADLRRFMDVSSATASDWCNGRKIPRTDKIGAICAWLNIELDDLLTQKAESERSTYFIDDEARDIAQFLFENPEYRVLFDASRKVKKEDLDIVKELLDRFS